MRYLLLCFLAICLPAATEPVSVYAYQLDYRLEESGAGDYQQLLQVLQKRGLEFSLSVLPVRRAVRALDEDVKGCMFPASIHAIITNRSDISPDQLISSDALDRVSLRVFTRPDSKTITSLTELNGSYVALWDGLNTEAMLGDLDVVIEPTNTEGIRVRMLHAHRLDAIIGFMPDVLLASEALGLPLPHYHPALALFLDEGVSFVCVDTKANRKFVAQADKLIRALKHSGELRQILSPHADIID